MTPTRFIRRLLTLAATIVVLATAGQASAQHPAERPADKATAPHGPGAHAKQHLPHLAPKAPAEDAHGQDAHEAHGQEAHGQEAHGQEAHGKGAHGKGAHGHDGPPPWPNLMHGLIGATEDGENKPPAGVEPRSGAWWSWYLTPTAWRGEDEPAPFIANIVNFLVLAFLLYRFGRKPISEGLKKRKATIMAEIDEATKIKNKATKRLEHYEAELDHLEDKLEELKEQYSHEAEADQKRIRKDASEARDRLMADAKFRIAQEGKTAQVELTNQALENALSAAEQLIKERVNQADHDRLANEFLDQIEAAIKEQSAPQGASQ